MPLIMKTENGTSSQQQQLCSNSNQVVASESNFSNGQLTSLPQPHQPQLINLSNGDVNDSSSQSSLTYQLLTSNGQPPYQSQQNGHTSTPSSSRTPKSTKSFKCDQCNMMFTTKSAHTSHIKSHAKQQQMAGGPNAVVANIAGASPNSQSSDPYQCDVCKKTFAVPARLVSCRIECSEKSEVKEEILVQRERIFFSETIQLLESSMSCGEFDSFFPLSRCVLCGENEKM